LKDLMAEDKNQLKAIVREILQKVLDLEMGGTLRAEKEERTVSRLGCRSGYYSRSLIMRVGKVELQM